MKKIIKNISKISSEIKFYFTEGAQGIAAGNLKMLQDVCLCGFIVTLIFFGLTPMIVSDWTITGEYFLLPPIFLFFFLWSFFYKRQRKKDKNPFVVQTMCTVFCMLLLSAFIVISTFPYPNGAEVFVAIWIMTMPTLFILHPVSDSIVSCGLGAAFIIMIRFFKSQACIDHDSFSVLLAIIISRIVIMILLRIRIDAFRTNQKIINASRTDMLTGVMNKKFFEETCAGICEGSAKKNAAFIILDIDDFKTFNDTLGHEVGDKVLCAVGECIRSAVPSGSIVGRIGGDEFAAMIFNAMDKTQIKAVTDNISNGIKLSSAEFIGTPATVSIGCVLLPNGGTLDYVEIYRRADKLLYFAKNGGKNMTVMRPFDEESNEE